jgi:hypothetical protein
MQNAKLYNSNRKTDVNDSELRVIWLIHTTILVTN